MIACLDLHDYNVNNRAESLLGVLKNYFDDFRVSLFTISAINGEKIKAEDWMQFIPHGLDHRGSEARGWGYAKFKHQIIPEIEDRFRMLGIPLTGGFCAPHWNWNPAIVEVLNDIEWWGAVSPERPDMPIPDTFYSYDYAIDDPFWESDKEVLKLHGHIGCTTDDLALCIDNLLRLPKDTEWHFVTDFLEERE